MTARFRFSLSVLLWVLPAVLLWWVLHPFLLQGIFIVVQWLLEGNFSRERLTMELNPQGLWLFHTQILYLEQLKPDKLKVYSMEMGDMHAFTMGFSLLWTFLLAISEAIRPKLKKLWWGSLVLLVFVILAIYLDSLVRIMRFMSRDNLGEIWITGHITQAVIAPPAWLIITIRKILPLTTYLAVIIAPITIAYWLNRDFIRAILFAGLLDKAVTRYAKIKRGQQRKNAPQ